MITEDEFKELARGDILIGNDGKSYLVIDGYENEYGYNAIIMRTLIVDSNTRWKYEKVVKQPINILGHPDA